MAERPFRFMDLQKKLRLMIYERLPVTTTHRKLDENSDDNLPPAMSGLTVVRQTITGLAILWTCREIHWEAGAVIQPVLNAIKRTPIRLISTPEMLDSYTLEYVLVYLVFSRLGELMQNNLSTLELTPNDLMSLCLALHSLQPDSSCSVDVPEYHVEIAVCWNKEQLDWSPWSRQYHLGEMINAFRFQQLDLNNASGHTRVLRLHIRSLSALSDDHEADGETLGIAKETDNRLGAHLRSTLDNSIEAAEWDSEWTEGAGRYV